MCIQHTLQCKLRRHCQQQVTRGARHTPPRKNCVLEMLPYHVSNLLRLPDCHGLPVPHPERKERFRAFWRPHKGLHGGGVYSWGLYKLKTITILAFIDQWCLALLALLQVLVSNCSTHMSLHAWNTTGTPVGRCTHSEQVHPKDAQPVLKHQQQKPSARNGTS
jgi:hypothetical protein